MDRADERMADMALAGCVEFKKKGGFSVQYSEFRTIDPLSHG